jgi:hypothetical protein
MGAGVALMDENHAGIRLGGIVAALLMVAPAATSSPAEVRGRIDRGIQECDEIPPHEVPPIATGVTPTLSMEVRVLAQSGDKAKAKELFKSTADAFSRVGVKIKARFQEVDTPAAWGDGSGTAGPDQRAILSFMKGIFGGERPPGVDLVYFMTRHWAGGFADCIGGVRYPDRAFAFGSIEYRIEGVVPAPTADEGVIAAHEIGHLLGAHHHYSNCAEALPSVAYRADVNPCTTMSPFAATASRTFGLVERSFIRSYVREFAKG